MKLFNKKSSNQDLTGVLKSCANAAKTGYSDAIIFLRSIKESHRKIESLILQSIDKMHEFGVTDASLFQVVKEQLNISQFELSKHISDTEEQLDTKRQQNSNFNIVLFGRTMCGKSTLMEILTNGNGKSIGCGSQRTTRDIRHYSWNGMTITDVPGIEAYDGEEDDRIAEEAAKYADLIIFMITAGQPEGNEADWLVKLKRMDKPIICLCNYKLALNDEHRLQRFLKNPDKYLSAQSIQEIKDQFNEFIAQSMSNERVTFYVAHLWAKFKSQNCDNPEMARTLANASQFDFIESQICKEVIDNGVMHRKRSFLSIVDNPIYLQYFQLLDFSAQAYRQYLNIKDKRQEFVQWEEDFNTDQLNALLDYVDGLYYRLKQSVPGFVEDNFARDDIKTRWQNNVANFRIEELIATKSKSIYSAASNKINELFQELGSEMKFTTNIAIPSIGGNNITNWQKRFGWGSAVSGAAGAVLLIASATNPVGWVLTGVSLLFGIFSWFSDSREKKSREARQKLSQNLYNSIQQNLERTKEQIERWFNKNIKFGIEKVAHNRFSLLQTTMLTLTNSQRIFAWESCANHREISAKIVRYIMEELGFSSEEISKVCRVARVPSKKCVIAVTDFFDNDTISRLAQTQRLQSKDVRVLLQKKLGSKEQIDIIYWNSSEPKEKTFLKLLRRYNLHIGKFKLQEDKKIDGNTHSLCYIKPQEFSTEQMDNLNIIQQLLEIHIIQR